MSPTSPSLSRPIVVGVALRDDDNAPVALGRRLAGLRAAPLTLVHVYPFDPPSAVPVPQCQSERRDRSLAACDGVDLSPDSPRHRVPAEG